MNHQFREQMDEFKKEKDALAAITEANKQMQSSKTERENNA